MKETTLENALAQGDLELLCIQGYDGVGDWEIDKSKDNFFEFGKRYSVQEVIDFVNKKNGEHKLETVESVNEYNEEHYHPNYWTWWVNTSGDYYYNCFVNNEENVIDTLKTIGITEKEQLENEVEIMCDRGPGDGTSYSPLFFIYVHKIGTLSQIKNALPNLSGADLWLLKTALEEEIKNRLINS